MQHIITCITFEGIWKYITYGCTQTLVHVVVIGWIGYHNSFLSGLPYIKINKLQKVQNAAARPITNSLRYCHITPVLQELHWLPARFRINFKILLMKFKIPIPLEVKWGVVVSSTFPLKSKKRSGDRAFYVATPHNGMDNHRISDMKLISYNPRKKLRLYNLAKHILSN